MGGFEQAPWLFLGLAFVAGFVGGMTGYAVLWLRELGERSR